MMTELDVITQAYLADVAKRFGSPGLNRTDITVSVPHSKLLIG